MPPHQCIVLLATLGEHEIIRTVLEELSDAIETLKKDGVFCRVLIVDDSKSADFIDHVESLFNEFSIDGMILTGNNNGLGGAIRFGFDVARNTGPVDFLVNLDADGQHNSRQIPKVVSKHLQGSFDLTIGSRWTEGGSAEGMGLTRKLLSKGASKILHQVGVDNKIKDPTTSFRVYSKRALELVSREAIDLEGFAFFGGSVAICCSDGLSIAEVPIDFRPRFHGKSKLTVVKVFESARQISMISSKSCMLRRRNTFLRDYEGLIVDSHKNPFKEYEVMVCAEENTAKHLIRYLGKTIAGKILEVGAGSGSYSIQLSEEADAILCIEPEESRFQALEKTVLHLENVSTFKGTLSQFLSNQRPTSSNFKFDCVFYAHVLEHIREDIAELRMAAKCLSREGNLVVVVPSLPRLYGSVDALTGHCRRYTKKELTAVAHAAGLEVLSIKYFNPLAIIPYWIMYRLIKVRSVGSGQLGLYDRIMVPLSYRLIDIGRGRIFGNNLIAILTKKSN
jgi:precorrin-6B methylase 2